MSGEDIREKVIKGLECCTDGMMCKRERCPYYDKSPVNSTCRIELEKDAIALLKMQELPTNASISSAIECLLHPQDADDSDMSKAIDTAVRALGLLRGDQEPRVMTFEEVQRWSDPMWIEVGLAGGTWAMMPKTFDVMIEFVTNGVYTLHPGFAISEYGKTWRCWTAKPTKQQSKAVKWNA